MDLSQFANARGDFFSELESIGTLDLDDTTIDYGMTLKLRDIRSLFSYLASIHAREPILHGSGNTMLSPAIEAAQLVMAFDAFIKTTEINNQPTFYFQASTFEDQDSLTFIDKGLLGGKNVYKPFDSGTRSAKDTMLTMSLDEVATFHNQFFKFKNYRGLAAFGSATVYDKGFIIEIVDRQMYLVIISAKYDLKKGVSMYTAVMIAKD